MPNSTADGVEQLVKISKALTSLIPSLLKTEKKKEKYDLAVIMALQVQLDLLEEDLKGSKVPSGFVAVKQVVRDGVAKWMVHLAKNYGFPPGFMLSSNLRVLLEELDALIVSLEP